MRDGPGPRHARASRPSRREGLLRAIDEFVTHYHGERNHQGLRNELITPKTHPALNIGVRCRERLGRLLRSTARPERGISFPRLVGVPDGIRYPLQRCRSMGSCTGARRKAVARSGLLGVGEVLVGGLTGVDGGDHCDGPSHSYSLRGRVVVVVKLMDSRTVFVKGTSTTLRSCVNSADTFGESLSASA